MNNINTHTHTYKQHPHGWIYTSRKLNGMKDIATQNEKLEKKKKYLHTNASMKD